MPADGRWDLTRRLKGLITAGVLSVSFDIFLYTIFPLPLHSFLLPVLLPLKYAILSAPRCFFFF